MACHMRSEDGCHPSHLVLIAFYQTRAGPRQREEKNKHSRFEGEAPPEHFYQLTAYIIPNSLGALRKQFFPPEIVACPSVNV